MWNMIQNKTMQGTRSRAQHQQFSESRQNGNKLSTFKLIKMSFAAITFPIFRIQIKVDENMELKLTKLNLIQIIYNSFEALKLTTIRIQVLENVETRFRLYRTVSKLITVPENMKKTDIKLDFDIQKFIIWQFERFEFLKCEK